MTTAQREYEKLLEEKTGLTIAQMQSMSPHETRDYFQKRTGRRLSFTSNYPFIPSAGHEITNGVRLLSSEEINAEVDKILGIKKEGLLARLFKQ